MPVRRTSPDLAVSKADSHTFDATFTTSSGTPTIDYGDGNTETSLTPSHAYSTGNPFLINITSDPKLITGITIENESVSAIGLDAFVNADTIDLRNNSLSERQTSKIIIALDGNGQNNGTLQLDGNSATLTAEAVTAGQSLIVKGWTISGLDWLPTSASELVAWYDADDASTITLNSGNASQWDDKSGNANHMVQATASLQPPYNATDTKMGSQASLGDSGDRRRMQPASAFTAHQMYAITYYDNATFGSWDVICTDDANSDRWAGWSGQAYFQDNGQDFIYLDGDTTTNYADNTGKPAILPLSSTSLFTTKFDASESTKWSLFGGGDSWQQWTRHGAIGEFIFTDGTESTTTKEKIEGYLAHKWGIEANLPGGHTYKSAPPTLFD